MSKINSKSNRRVTWVTAWHAALIGANGDTLGIVLTAQKAGSVRYYCQKTDGTPVNTRIGKISRSKRNLEIACRQHDPCSYYLTEGVDFFGQTEY